MTPEQEKKVLASIYDRLHDAVTYSPAGKTAAFPKQNICFQMTKNTVIRPSDFAGMLSPVTPDGNQAQAELFSDMVDALPNAGPLWADSQNKLSTVYGKVLGLANADSTPVPAQQVLYDKAYAVLNTKTKDSKGVETISQSAIALAYDTAKSAYVDAVAAFRTAYNNYDMTDPKQQRKFNAAAPPLQNKVEQTWSAWGRAGKAAVEQAQATLASTINDAVSIAIQDAQLATSAPLPRAGGSGTWLPSYGRPTEWAAADLAGPKLTITSSYLAKTSSTQADSYGVEASGSYGLFHASGGVEGEHKRASAHMQAETLQLEAELIAVSIIRPWFSPLLFGMKNWWVRGYGKNQLSNGDSSNPAGEVPLIPTGFVVAKNVKITADFSEQDKKFVSDTVSAKASGGWGPFSFSGKYGHSSSKEDFDSKFDGGSLLFPGLQLIAWISTVTPASPPLKTK